MAREFNESFGFNELYGIDIGNHAIICYYGVFNIEGFDSGPETAPILRASRGVR